MDVVSHPLARPRGDRPCRVVPSLALAAVLVVVVVAGLVTWRLLAPETCAAAGAVAWPRRRRAGSSWTDWEGVRRELDADVDADSSAEDVDAFLAEAFAADLSSMSALGTLRRRPCRTSSASPPRRCAGSCSPSRGDGAVEVLGVADDAVLRRPRRAARRRWAGPSRTTRTASGSAGPTCWPGSARRSPRSSSTSPCCADRGLVLTSDQAPYLEQVAGGRRRRRRRRRRPGRPRRGARASRSRRRCTTAPTPASASRWRRPTTTPRPRPTSWSTAAGGVHPLTGFAMGVLAGGDVRARACRSRTRTTHRATPTRAPQLAAGPGARAGRRLQRPVLGGGRRLARVARSRSTCDPRRGQYVLSDLTSGPVLFATC